MSIFGNSGKTVLHDYVCSPCAKVANALRSNGEALDKLKQSLSELELETVVNDDHASNSGKIG